MENDPKSKWYATDEEITALREKYIKEGVIVPHEEEDLLYTDEYGFEWLLRPTMMPEAVKRYRQFLIDKGIVTERKQRGNGTFRRYN